MTQFPDAGYGYGDGAGNGHVDGDHPPLAAAPSAASGDDDARRRARASALPAWDLEPPSQLIRRPSAS
jgi:hypothetical protein